MAMIFILNMSIGLLTPPVGYCLFVSSSIAEVPMESTAINAIPIILTMIGVLALVNIIPQLSLWVPSLVH
jgi:TRAP-type C4-dicarboxylate transport system permease large subunit